MMEDSGKHPATLPVLSDGKIDKTEVKSISISAINDEDMLSVLQSDRAIDWRQNHSGNVTEEFVHYSIPSLTMKLVVIW